MIVIPHNVELCKQYFLQDGLLLTLFWTGGGANLPPPPAGFLNIAQKPLGLGS